MKHWTLSTTKSKSKAATKGTHAKGEGSTKRAILRGLELPSFSEPSKAPSFSPSPRESTSAVMMFPASSTKLFLPPVAFNPWKEHNRAPIQERVMGFNSADLKRWNLVGCGEDDEEQKGGENEGFIVIAVALMVVKMLSDEWVGIE